MKRENQIAFAYKLLDNRDRTENTFVCLMWMTSHNCHLVLVFIYGIQRKKKRTTWRVHSSLQAFFSFNGLPFMADTAWLIFKNQILTTF